MGWLGSAHHFLLFARVFLRNSFTRVHCSVRWIDAAKHHRCPKDNRILFAILCELTSHHTQSTTLLFFSRTKSKCVARESFSLSLALILLSLLHRSIHELTDWVCVCFIFLLFLLCHIATSIVYKIDTICLFTQSLNICPLYQSADTHTDNSQQSATCHPESRIASMCRTLSASISQRAKW